MTVITGTAAGDRLWGTIFADQIHGGAGNDWISGGQGADLLNGGDGDDMIVERDGGADTIDGGAGDDVILVDRRGKYGLYIQTSELTPVDTVRITGGTGNDSISFAWGNYFVDAGDGDDVVRLLAGASATITLGLGRDTLTIDDFAMSGQMVSVPLWVADFKTGNFFGGGDRLDLHTLLGSKLTNWDQVSNPFASGHVRLAGDSYGVTVNIYSSGFGSSYSNLMYLSGVRLSALTDYNLAGFTTSSTASPATSMTGTAADETLYGTAGADTIDGGAGHDRIEGGFGDDILHGGDDDDYLNGQTGRDILHGGAGNDRLEDTAGGSDTLHGEAGDDVIVASRSFNMPAGTLTLNGGAGRDDIGYRWVFDGSETTFPTKIFSTLIDAGEDDDIVRIGGVRGIVDVTLGAGADTLILGTDFVLGKGTIAIADFQAGDAGDSIDLAGFLAATVSGWNGSDNPFATGHLRVVQDAGGQILVQVNAAGSGSAFVTVFTLGAVDANSLTAVNFAGWSPGGGSAAGVAFDGGDGDDVFTGGAGADVFNGLGGDDILAGGAGNDILSGGEGKDRLYGGSGDDMLDGGAGDDLLEDSDGGADRFFGEAGNDRIVIARAANAPAGLTAQASGGDGDDAFTIAIANASSVVIDGGDGNDSFAFQLLKGSATLTLGAGQDAIRLEREYFGPNINQTRVQPIVVTDFEAGPNGDVIDMGEALAYALGWPAAGANFRAGNVRLVQSGSDVLLQYSYSPSSSSAVYQTLIVFQNLLVSDFTSDNFPGEQLAQTLVIAEAGGIVTNAASIFGMPAVRLAAEMATFVNAAGGWVEAGHPSQAGEVRAAVQFGAAGGTLVNEKGAVIAGPRSVTNIHSAEAQFAVLGSAFGDIVYNQGKILGTVSLGAGNDRFVETLGPENNSYSNSIVELGDGDDLADFDLAGVTYVEFRRVDGGAGQDVLVYRNITGAVTAEWMATGFEKMHLMAAASGATLTMKLKPAIDEVHLSSGLTLAVTDRSSGRPYTLTPSGTLYLDGGNFATGLQASFARIIGSDAAETVILRGSRAVQAGYTALGLVSVDLGGGDDVFEWGYSHARPGAVEGGSGLDRLKVSQRTAAVDLSVFTGFETVETDYYSAFFTTSFVQTLSGIGADALRLLLGSGRAGIVQLDLNAPLLAVGASDAKLVILAGTTVGSVADRELLEPGVAAQAQWVENHGLVAGNVDLGGGSDVLVNSGRIDGDVRLGSGNDSFTSLSGSSVGGSIRGGHGDDLYVIGNRADMVLEQAGEGIDEVRTALGSRSDFAAMYILPANVENLTGTSATGQGVYGNALDNVIKMGAGGDLIVLQDGGDDRVESGGGNDFIYYGVAFTNADSNDGGTGNDTVGLLGNYTLTFDADDLVSIEALAAYSSGNPAAPNSYNLTTVDANVAAGGHLTVTGMSLSKIETLVFNGAAETDGRFTINGGKGDDTITGGMGKDLIWGNLGADVLRGGGGNDSFEYYAIADSTIGSRDIIMDFSAGDKINLWNIDADGNAANGNSQFSFIGNAAFGNKAGELRVSEAQGGGWLVEGDVDGDGVADLSILVHVAGGHILGANDFIL